MLIHPEVIVTPDCPTIKFRQQPEQVNLDVELPKILHSQGWGVGTYFHVQFISHDKTKLLSAARFVVTEEVETLATTDDPYRPVTKTVFARRAEQIGDWWSSVKQDTVSSKKPGEMTYVKPGTLEPLVEGTQMTAGEFAKSLGGDEVIIATANHIEDEIKQRSSLNEDPKRRGRPPKTAVA